MTRAFGAAVEGALGGFGEGGAPDRGGAFGLGDGAALGNGTGAVSTLAGGRTVHGTLAPEPAAVAAPLDAPPDALDDGPAGTAGTAATGGTVPRGGTSARAAEVE